MARGPAESPCARRNAHAALSRKAGCAQRDDLEIGGRLVERGVRDSHEREDGVREHSPRQGYSGRSQKGDPEGCDECAALALLVASTHAVAHCDGAARHEPYGYRADDEDDGGGVADRDEPRLADDVANDAHIDELVDVLKDVRRDERGRERRQASCGASFQEGRRVIRGF